MYWKMGGGKEPIWAREPWVEQGCYIRTSYTRTEFHTLYVRVFYMYQYTLAYIPYTKKFWYAYL